MQQPPASLSDGALVSAVLAGQRECFAPLVQRYQAALLQLAQSRLARHDWAEDVVQETFLCAFKSLHSYDSRYSFRTWLWAILLNQCRRHARRHARRPQIFFWSDNCQQGDATGEVTRQPAGRELLPPAQLLAKERAQTLQRLLRQLPEAEADALRLRFFASLKFQEIADAMGCSLSTAKTRVRWGLTRMAAMLTPEPRGNSTATQPNSSRRG